MKYWQEIRTAAHVARLGSIRAAARELEIHRATVLRHVDLLESALGIRLFRRHSRGYSPTDAALELLEVAEATESQIAKIAELHRREDDRLSGQVTVTSTLGAARDVLPAIKRLALDHPELQVLLRVSASFLSLENGEADIALRMGDEPDLPNHVVYPLCDVRFGMFASTEYIHRHGAPKNVSELGRHYFAGPISEAPKAGFLRWLVDHVPADRIVVRSNEVELLDEAVFNGTAIGLLASYAAEARGNLVPVLSPEADWTSHVWLVTHESARKVARIQACLKVLQEQAHVFEA